MISCLSTTFFSLSLGVVLMKNLLYRIARCLHTSKPCKAQYDTHALYKAIQGDSLKTEQSEAIIKAFSQMLEDKMAACTQRTISKADYERHIYLHKIDLAQLKNDIQQYQKNETLSSLHLLEGLFNDLALNRQKMREKLASLKSEMRLEMSLEKGRMRDSVLSYNLKYQDLYSKIDTEASNGYAATGKLRHDIFYSLTGISYHRRHRSLALLGSISLL